MSPISEDELENICLAEKKKILKNPWNRLPEFSSFKVISSVYKAAVNYVLWTCYKRRQTERTAVQ